MRKLLFMFTILLLLIFQSCSNKDKEFPDFEYQTVYFAYQYPVRTITLGEDFVNTTMDNEHRFQIMATLGGVYSNGNDVIINFVVDTTICSGYKYENGTPIRYMPESYYQLASNTIVIPAGKVAGGVEVQLTDAFFADTLAISTNYVVPIRMVSIENADSILSGKPFPLVTNPMRLVATDWEVQPKDFVLYAVKYVNPWHGYYLRRGRDVITGKPGFTNLTKNIVRHQKYVENDEVMLLKTRSLSMLDFPVVHKDSVGNSINITLRLTFDNQGNCVVSSPSSAYTATGSGKYIKLGEKNSWGYKDRDALYLQYSIDHTIMNISTTDTLVLRNRGVGMEVFKVMP